MISYAEVLAEYVQNRTSTNERDDERLFQLCTAYLTNRQAGKRFRALGGEDVYRLLKKLVGDGNSRPDALLKIKEGFSHVEQYARNLWRSPWRKEFHVIKTHTGFFKSKVERLLPHKPTVVRLITCLGYKTDDESKDHFIFKEDAVNVEQLKEMSLCLFLVTVDLAIIHGIAVDAENEGYSLRKAIRARSETVRGKDEALSALLKWQPDGSTKKKPKLEEDSEASPTPGFGRTSSESSSNSADVDMLNAQKNTQDQREDIQSNIKGSQRQPKYPPSDTPAAVSTTSSGASVGAHHSSHYTFPSGTGHSGTLGPDQLTDDMLYGHSEPSVETPASEEMAPSSEFGDFTGGNIPHSQSPRLPQTHREENLYVNLTEMGTNLPTIKTAAWLYQNSPGAQRPLSEPTSPPPPYDQAVMMDGSELGDDYEVIENPENTQGQPILRDEHIRQSTNHVDVAQNFRSYRGSELSTPNVPISGTPSLHDGRYASRGTEGIGGSAHGYASSSVMKSRPSATKTYQSERLSDKRRDGCDPRLYEGTATRGSNGYSSNIYENVFTDASSKAELSLPGRHTGLYGTKDVSPYSKELTLFAITRRPASSPLPVSNRDSHQASPRVEQGSHTVHNHVRYGTGSEISHLVEGKVETPLTETSPSPCEFCAAVPSTHVCDTCYKLSCGRCMYIYDTDFCKEGKLRHKFVDMTKTKGKASAEHRTPASPPDSLTEWNCARCTYANTVTETVCIMCATTRGLSGPEMPQAGRPVCRECTYHNEEGSKVCEACCKSLRGNTAETTV